MLIARLANFIKKYMGRGIELSSLYQIGHTRGKQQEKDRILAALERLQHHGTWQDGTAIYWRADEVIRVVRREWDD